METPRLITTEFWNDGSVWIGLSAEHSQPGSAGLAEFAQEVLHAQDWCFFQTSGTEGRPKWVGLKKASLLASAKAVNAHFAITAQDHWLLALPTHHVGGFGILARAHLSGSAVTQLEGKWNAMAFVSLCAENKASLASLVPTQVFDLVAARLACPPAMRMVLVGGGALSEDIFQSARRLGWPLCRTYGMTETSSQVASQVPDGNAMEVLPLWQLSTNAEGVLTIRGESLAEGYAFQDDSGAWHWQPISAGEGLRTRDRVSLHTCEDGRQILHFVGREAGIVKILGELVALGPVQEHIDALRLKLGILGDAAVCDVRDERKEHALVLAVSGMEDLEADTLLTALNAHLRPLEHIEHTRHLEAIPRSELGKVQLGELRPQLTSQ